MKKNQCKEALEIYKTFLSRMNKLSEFLKVAEVRSPRAAEARIGKSGSGRISLEQVSHVRASGRRTELRPPPRCRDLLQTRSSPWNLSQDPDQLPKEDSSPVFFFFFLLLSPLSLSSSHTWEGFPPETVIEKAEWQPVGRPLPRSFGWREPSRAACSPPALHAPASSPHSLCLL